MKKALQINQALYGEDGVELIRLYNNIGEVEGELGNREEELKLRNKALEVAILQGF